MDKYLGKWTVGDEYSESGKIGEVIVEDTKISLKIEDMMILSRNCIVSKIDMKYIKVYCNSVINGRGYAYRLIKYNNFDDGKEIQGTEINNITEASFHIPNLIEWLNLFCIENKVVQATYIEVEPIIISDSAAKISIEYSPSLPETIPSFGFPTQVVLKNTPNIRIRYSVPVNIDRLEKDILNVSRFFALLIGRIDSVTDIHFKTQNSKGWFWSCNIADYTTCLKAMHTSIEGAHHMKI